MNQQRHTSSSLVVPQAKAFRPLIRIARYVDRGDGPLIIQGTLHTTMLGLYEPSAKTPTLVDLTPYGGQKKGVSHLHAVIRCREDGLTVEVWKVPTVHG